ncbi:hypothetical protein AGR5A_Cc170467 [Agrobacterium genomosp. 5 str. CFBP 6626]|nr:hypothetical protein AGR5A_Cc170467 [Agrobacterium genomosp. 5 str. CFBP 6626]
MNRRFARPRFKDATLLDGAPGVHDAAILSTRYTPLPFHGDSRKRPFTVPGSSKIEIDICRP